MAHAVGGLIKFLRMKRNRKFSVSENASVLSAEEMRRISVSYK